MLSFLCSHLFTCSHLFLLFSSFPFPFVLELEGRRKKRKFFCSEVLLSLNYTHSLFLSCLSIQSTAETLIRFGRRRFCFILFFCDLSFIVVTHIQNFFSFRSVIQPSIFFSQIFAQNSENSENICSVVTCYSGNYYHLICVCVLVRERWCVYLL